MTREEQLVFCKKCTNRKLDMQQGLLCGLTNEKADFNLKCDTFNLDAEAEERLSKTEEVEGEEATIAITEKELEKLKRHQNYRLALIAGLVVGLLGAILWGVITVVTGYQIGYMAIAIGAGVGIAMRYAGKGIDPIFGFTGAIIAILSCVLGNYFSIVGYLADFASVGYLEVIKTFSFSDVFSLMVESFSPIDILFYGFAAFEGYKFAFRVVTEEDLLTLKKERF
ncbi:hypothetical protein M4I21_04820 [Cellulophaga sp. 20_2_10]|uniref:hypothetical protein n=1 Tax=Cellulophaga sp. 20_2_10 TaxID=2942476 RepID=UPI00201AD7BF|nr:hypothetical protein [Cellulophaga sp. 20_2_10]MCL5245119.1 hypothetical protein [Cellulophaga sp. 20_2_10]